jgi:hypothetical protein
MLLMAVLLSISAQDIVLTHPRPLPTYRATTELPCGEDGTYVFVVETRGMTSQLLTSTLNGEPIELREPMELRSDGTSLRDTVARLGDAWIQPLSCVYGAGALVVVHGVNKETASSPSGEPVRVLFQADVRSRAH